METTILGGPWDLVISYSWGIIALFRTGVTSISPFRELISRVISPVISSYEVPWASE